MTTTAEGAPVTSPTDAHQATVALCHRVLLECARRRQDQLPGLVETLQDQVVLTTGGTARRAYGWFIEDIWRFGDRRVHELFLNAHRHASDGRAESPAEEVLTTLLHEACHAWAQANSLKDTSRGGQYHNRRFAEIALAIGLAVEPDPRIGHRTPGLAPWAQAEYADLLRELGHGLVLSWEPERRKRPTSGPQPDDGSNPARYVFASCRCRNARGRTVTIRVASGSWRPDVIRCSICEAAFVESPTTRRQADAGSAAE
jgi:hypothetical protein